MKLTLFPLLATLGLTVAVPAPAKQFVTATIFNSSACTSPGIDQISLTDTDCKPLSGKTMSVVTHDGSLRYNALHVFKTDDCTGGWTLQPLGAACSHVEAFHSIRVVLG